jgi:outer membrane murein-binding lipoprotein Lpp
MGNVLTIVLVAFLTGCASSKSLVVVEDKINLINSDMADLSNRIDFLAKKESTNMGTINNKIEGISQTEKASYASVGQSLVEVGHAIEHINNKLSDLNKKTDRISKKLLATKSTFK